VNKLFAPLAPAVDAFRRHWPEYLMEAAELGMFMTSACSFTVLLFHPDSPLVSVLPLVARRLIMGLTMGATGACIVYSPFGKQSGAHFNPAVTLTFLRLGRVGWWDALFYVVGQFLGAITGVGLAALVAGMWLSNDSVRYAVTTPGVAGVLVAWVTEFVLAFGLMTIVLVASNTPKVARYTGVFTAALVAAYIPAAAALSGMSMNPARSFASAAVSQIWTGLWIYFTAPPLAMLLAAECYIRLRGRSAVFCAKLHHDNDRRCIFCESRAAQAEPFFQDRNPRPSTASKTAASRAMHV
jgi:aquaporin Z